MATLETVTLRTGARVQVRVTSSVGRSDSPPLLLLPGVGGAKEQFDSILPRISEIRGVISPDLSPIVAGGQNPIDSTVADVLEVLDSLQVSRCHVLGQSFGSMAAVRLWKQQPQRIRSLLLAPPAVIHGGIRGVSKGLQWLCLGSLIWIWPRNSDASLERMIRGLGGYPPEPQIEDGQFRNLIQRVHQVDPRALARRLMVLPGHSWQQELEGVSAPVLILVGELERQYLSADLASFFENRKRTVTECVPGGHMPFLSHPDEFLSAVDSFLGQNPG